MEALTISSKVDGVRDYTGSYDSTVRAPHGTLPSHSLSSLPMIEKDLSPAGKSMRVHFSLPAEVAEESVAIVGDFNGWDAEADLMELQPINGVWKKRISFKPGTQIEFKYRIDGDDWRNDEEADAYAPNEHGTENSILNL